MLVYEKKVDDELAVYGTMDNVPSDDDNAVTFTDTAGNEVELTRDDSLFDTGRHGMKDADDVEILAWIDDENIIPGSVAATEVSDEDELVAALAEGGYVKMTADIDLSEGIVLTADTILDMNGQTLYNTEEIWDTTNDRYALLTVNGVNLTITGNGTFQTLENDEFCVNVLNGGTVTIKNGTYVGNISAVQVQEGACNVEGGEFSIQQLSEKYSDYRYILNCIDAYYKAGTANFYVSGGTFHGFDPGNNLAEGSDTNFLKDGYVSTETSDSVYEVTAEE